MKRVVVTGGTGFVGANLVRRLVADGHQVHLLVRPEFSSWRIDSIRDRIAIHQVNLGDSDGLTSTLRTIEPAWVFHLAAYGAYSWQTDEKQMNETNVVGTQNLLRAALNAGVESFVNEGSVVGVFGDRIAVTFVPPFMKEGETVRIILNERVDEAVPIVLAAPGGIGGFTLSRELPPGTAAKVRAGMTVRRK